MKKFCIVGGVILGILVVFVILCFTLFGLSSISINFKTSSLVFDENSYDEIIENSGLKQGSCVLFLNKKLAEEKLEKQYPYLKIINIETVFPNKVVIHCAEREEVFAINLNNNKYAICDENLKVLNITNIENYESVQSNPILLSNLFLNETQQNISIGDFFNFYENSLDFLNKICEAFKLNNRSIVEIKGLIKSIDIEYIPSVNQFKNLPTLVLQDFQNYKTKIVDSNNLLPEKISAYLEVSSQLTFQDKQNSYLYIYQDTKTGKIISHLVKENI